ncbi:MAG: endonuclease/exonuclease/phosphatase family protein [Proteobacteria bacterium]|nr:endonuclease/exonuclease/phosphatase family protein [Pseudomonadota bacterium]
MIFVSYNIQWGTGKDGRVDLARIAGEIGAADVIALQEVDRFWTRSRMTDQAAEFAALFPEHHWVYGPGMDMDASIRGDDGRLVTRRRQFGNMVLSRAPILAARNHLLPKMALAEKLSLQRAAQEAVIEAPSGPLRVYSVHLNHSSVEERLIQIARLRAIVAGAPGEGGAWSGQDYRPVWEEDGPQPPMPARAILMGDFNLTPDSPEHAAFCDGAHGLVDSWRALGHEEGPGWTCHEDKGGWRIDYAFVTADLKDRLRAMSVDHAAQGSDHQPIRVEIGL